MQFGMPTSPGIMGKADEVNPLGPASRMCPEARTGGCCGSMGGLCGGCSGCPCAGPDKGLFGEEHEASVA